MTQPVRAPLRWSQVLADRTEAEVRRVAGDIARTTRRDGTAAERTARGLYSVHVQSHDDYPRRGCLYCPQPARRADLTYRVLSRSTGPVDPLLPDGT